MKLITLLVFSIFLFLNIHAQVLADKKGIKLYEEGTTQINLGNYRLADSLLSLSLETFTNKDVFFNRAVCRLLLLDTLGFCKDMDVLANTYLDNEASPLFNKLCCSNVDTVYYNKKLIPQFSGKYRYLEEIRHMKYHPRTIGVFHDLSVNKQQLDFDFSSEQGLTGSYLEDTDIIGVYEIIDSIKFYISRTSGVTIVNYTKYLEIKKRAKLLLQVKYGSLKSNNKIEELKIAFQLAIDKTGKIVDLILIGSNPVVDLASIKTELKKDLWDIVNNYPKITPGTFLGEKVNCLVNDAMIF
jgi:hypothetical protein